MFTFYRFSLLWCVGVLALSACGKSSTSSYSPTKFGVVDKDATLTPDAFVLSQDLREGALRILEQLLGTQTNVVVSPFAAQTAIGMMYLGAQGNTIFDIRQGMRWSQQPETFGPSYKNLTSIVATHLLASPTSQVQTATRLWSDEALTLNSSYKK